MSRQVRHQGFLPLGVEGLLLDPSAVLDLAVDFHDTVRVTVAI